MSDLKTKKDQLSMPDCIIKLKEIRTQMSDQDEAGEVTKIAQSVVISILTGLSANYITNMFSNDQFDLFWSFFHSL